MQFYAKHAQIVNYCFLKLNKLLNFKVEEIKAIYTLMKIAATIQTNRTLF